MYMELIENLFFKVWSDNVIPETRPDMSKDVTAINICLSPSLSLLGVDLSS